MTDKPEDPGWPAANNRFTTSPVQSVFRYFSFETFSWRQTITRSGLPVESQDLIRTMVRKSRLWRFKKTEVVQEYSNEDFQALFPNRGRNQSVDSGWIRNQELSPEARRFAAGAIIETL